MSLLAVLAAPFGAVILCLFLALAVCYAAAYARLHHCLWRQSHSGHADEDLKLEKVVKSVNMLGLHVEDMPGEPGQYMRRQYTPQSATAAVPAADSNSSRSSCYCHVSRHQMPQQPLQRSHAAAHTSLSALIKHFLSWSPGVRDPSSSIMHESLVEPRHTGLSISRLVVIRLQVLET